MTDAQAMLAELREKVERLEAEVDRFRRPNERDLCTSDPIVPLPGFQPPHLKGLALLFREWCHSDLWGGPSQAEQAARQVETAFHHIDRLQQENARLREAVARERHDPPPASETAASRNFASRAVRAGGTLPANPLEAKDASDD